MWALRAYPAIAGAACRVFYRLDVAGEQVPRSGPALLVANHPNAVLDPSLVVIAARRPVRFLAAAPLFEEPFSGTWMRAVGAIPVYRRMDDPALVDRNEAAFRTVFEALAAGWAVGIFPEGISHSEPSLVPLKTGAARIALGAAPRLGGTFPLIPVGLVFEAKERFRSRAFVTVGEPVKWVDLSACGAADHDAVRELTRRIDDCLHAITLNFEQWEDAPLIDSATAIYTAEFGAPAGAGSDVLWRSRAARALSRLRRLRDPEAMELAADIRRHQRRLDFLVLAPADLHRRSDLRAAVGWTAHRLAIGRVATTVAMAIGAILFWIPLELTRPIATRLCRTPLRMALYKILIGTTLCLAWLALLAGAAAITAGWKAGIAAVVVLPIVGLARMVLLDRWQTSVRDARSFFVLRSRRARLQRLHDDQTALARRLRRLWKRSRGFVG
jgi:glycerol-3-phosphate O-acyltransferase / dihydroxyacetone phosphate acyltransferase